MSTGSKTRLELSRSARERAPRLALLAGLLCSCVSITACQHSIGRRSEAPEHESPTVTGDDLFVLAMAYIRRSDFLRAEQYLHAARERGYEEQAVVFWLVRVCVAAGRYHSALQHATSHLRDHPSHFALRLVVASIHEALGDVEHAQSALESIVSDAPEWALPQYRLGMLYRARFSAGDRARRHLERYLELAPEGPHAAEVRTVLKRKQAAVVEASNAPVSSVVEHELEGAQ